MVRAIKNPPGRLLTLIHSRKPCRAGTSVGGVIVPLAMGAALENYGFRVALRGCAATMFVITATTLFFIKPRLPPSRARRFDFSLLFTPTFVILQLGNIVCSLGFFIPTIYLPTYARCLGGSPILGSTTLVAFKVASVLGCIGASILVGRFRVTIPVALSAFGSTIACLVLWGLAGNILLLFIFSVMYGLFAGVFSSTWPGVITLATSKTARAEPTLIYSFLAAGR